MKRFLIAAPVAFLTACSSQPENIKASYVSYKSYDSYGCEEVMAERRTVVARVRELSREQAELATKDAVATAGALIFLPTLLLLAAGTDQEEEIASLKGQHEALTEAARRRGCLSEAELASETEAAQKQVEQVRRVLVSSDGDHDEGGVTGGGSRRVFAGSGASPGGVDRAPAGDVHEPEVMAAEPVAAPPRAAEEPVSVAPTYETGTPETDTVAVAAPAADDRPPRRPEPEQVIRVRGDGAYKTYETWFDFPEVSDIRVALEDWDEEHGVVRFTGFAHRNGGPLEMTCEARARRSNRCERQLNPYHKVEISAAPPHVEVTHTLWGVYVNSRAVEFW